MSNTKRRKLLPKNTDKLIILSAIILAVYGSIMIISAEMGESTADLKVLSSTSIKQGAYLIIGIVCLLLFTKFGGYLTKIRTEVFWFGFYVMSVLLIVPRLFSPAGGAYGWIRFGGFSVQPSEFAKVYIILLASKVFSKNDQNNNLSILKRYFIALGVFAFIVIFIEKDLGSAVVILAIGYVCALVAPYKEYIKYQNIMMLLILIALALLVFLLSSPGTALLSHFKDNYQILRFLASANPFNYQYDSGYHLIMSLVSFATGGWFGLGYSKSIHKFMNFPNPSTDFILPVIVEEMGIVFGFIPVICLYGLILFPLAHHALKCDSIRGKIVMLGTFMYFVVHFVLNVGGVSGIIPLTGVPLLLVSSGGSSLIACMISLGLAESEIACYLSKKANTINENNSR